MDRRALLSFAGASLATAALAGCASSGTATPSTSSASAATPTAAPARATIGLTYIPNIQFAPFYVAEQRGLFAEAGATVSLRHHGASEGLITAIAAGQEDFVILGGDELLQTRGQGIDLVAIAAFYHAYPVALLVKETSPIKSLTDLRGRKVGIPGKYGETYFATLVALKTAGLSSSDVQIVEIGYTQQAAIAANKVDAVMGFVNNDQVQFTLAGIVTRAIPISIGTPPLVSICLATTRSYLEAHPEVATKIADAMIGGISVAVKEPAAALAAAEPYVPGITGAAAQKSAAAVLAATAPLWQTAGGQVSGKFDPTQWAQMTTFMESAGLLKGPVDATTGYSNAVVSS